MKKYIYLISILLLFIIIKVSTKSYAFQEDCSNYIDNPKVLNSKNLNDYLQEKNYENKVNYFCSFNNCYHLRNENITEALYSYLILQERKGLDDYVIEAKVKGYPITKISINICQ